MTVMYTYEGLLGSIQHCDYMVVSLDFMGQVIKK